MIWEYLKKMSLSKFCKTSNCSLLLMELKNNGESACQELEMSNKKVTRTFTCCAIPIENTGWILNKCNSWKCITCKRKKNYPFFFFFLEQNLEVWILGILTLQLDGEVVAFSWFSSLLMWSAGCTIPHLFSVLNVGNL